MKKVLFASTALVALAGAAAAEVTISGNAEMGLIVGDGGVAATDGEVEFFTDVDVTFTMSGETDSGLTYGASIDLDESDGTAVTAASTSTTVQAQDAAGNRLFLDVNGNQVAVAAGVVPPAGSVPVLVTTTTTTTTGSGASNAFSGRTQGGESVFLSGAFGTLTAGDTDGALDWALTEVAFNSGSLNDDETEHSGYNGNSGLDGSYDGQIVRYDYSIGDFGIGVSAEIDDADANVASGNDPILGVGIRYNLDFTGISGLGLGLGYQNGDNAEAIGASLNGTVLGFNAGVSYLKRNGVTAADTYDHYGVGLGYVTGPVSLSANYGQYDYDAGADSDGFGLSAGYDLGGGALVQVGYGNSNPRAGANFDTFSFGVRMNF